MTDSKVMKSSAVIIISMFLLGACSDDLDSELEYLINLHQVNLNPIADYSQQVRSIEDKDVQLGKLLFFSKSLSGNKDVACASCHHPFLGGDDNLSLSIGIDPIETDVLGSHRTNVTGKVLVPRNAPTSFNSSLWKKHLFHDGRVERINPFDEIPAIITTPDERFGDVDDRAISLVQAQAGFPVTSEHEMRANYFENTSNERLRSELLKKFLLEVGQYSDSESWLSLFKGVYPDEELEALITFEKIQHLLGEYEKSQVFVDTPWRAFVLGDRSAISTSAKNGALLFYKGTNEGGVGCVNCHTGSFFTDEKFHILAFPQIGEGKNINEDDTGRFLRTGVPDDRYAFRTPSLLNVEVTAPYGHSGSYLTLEEVIRHHLDPNLAVSKYDYSLKSLGQQGIFNGTSQYNTQKALNILKKRILSGVSGLNIMNLSDDQVADLVEFLRALTDPCVTDLSCLKPWVPDISEPNPDNSILYLAN